MDWLYIMPQHMTSFQASNCTLTFAMRRHKVSAGIRDLWRILIPVAEQVSTNLR